MTMYMASPAREGKKLNDVIFQARAKVQAAIAAYGKERVVNGTLGAFADDEGNVACIPTVETLFRSMEMRDFICYAPPVGLPAYRDAVLKAAFADQRPDAYVAAVASAGGTGAVHMAIANYSDVGDYVLTTDWRWDAYGALCSEIGRNLTTFPLFDDTRHFHIAALEEKVRELCQHQDSLLLILNTPAHNPTGFGLSEADWDAVLAIACKEAGQGKRISILIDIAYIDYAGEKNDVRRFMKKFSSLPDKVFVMLAFSMSKGYTMYGQRAGALVGISANTSVIDEFNDVVLYSARAAWSNINRGAMTLLTTIQNDAALCRQFEAERHAFYETIRRRAAVFMTEAKECQLAALPYQSGFFISIPAKNSALVCDKLADSLIFAGPLAMGVRFAVCSVSERKMKGVASAMKQAFIAAGE